MCEPREGSRERGAWEEMGGHEEVTGWEREAGPQLGPDTPKQAGRRHQPDTPGTGTWRILVPKTSTGQRATCRSQTVHEEKTAGVPDTPYLGRPPQPTLPRLWSSSASPAGSLTLVWVSEPLSPALCPKRSHFLDVSLCLSALSLCVCLPGPSRAPPPSAPVACPTRSQTAWRRLPKCFYSEPQATSPGVFAAVP